MKFKTVLLITAIAMISVHFQTATAQAAASPRVLILPFDIHADRDLSFLQKGIQAMLSTRLSIPGKADPIPREESQSAVASMPQPIGEKAAVLLGVSLGADYVVFGSLTVFGSGISTDVRFIDARQQKPVVNFNQFGQNNGDVISHVNQFAEQVRTGVFGLQPRLAPTAASPQGQEQPQAPVNTSRAHPEALWAARRGGSEGGFIQSEPAVLGYGAQPSVAAGVTAMSWKSPRIREEIRGIGAGDVDGDGKNEIVYISKQTVFIHRYSEGRFLKVSKIQGGTADDFLSVDVGDINKNGKAEIFVTNIQENANRLRSFVLEWDGAGFQRIGEEQNWFFRIINVPAQGGDLLMGQHHGQKYPFSNPDKYELEWKNGRYEKSQRQNLPKSQTVYGFTYGNALNDGREVTLAITKDERLRVYDRTGEEEFTSDENYGSGTVYVRVPSKIRIHPGSKDDFHLPQRIFIKDLDKDGKNEILVAQNIDLFGRMAQRSRSYRKGRIDCLNADRLGFTPKWRTREISQQISDFCLADLDNDGEIELGFVAVLKTDTTVLSKPSSIIVIQELQK